MKRDRILGALLLVLAVAVVAAMLIDDHVLWFLVDLFMIATAGIGGIILVTRKS